MSLPLRTAHDTSLQACCDGAESCAQDANLRHTLQFGIGLHHAGLGEADRTVVEQLFVGGKIQVLSLLHCLVQAADPRVGPTAQVADPAAGCQVCVWGIAWVPNPAGSYYR